MSPENETWPTVALAEWQDTYETLHRWAMMIDNLKKHLCPLENQWWQLALHPGARGLSTGPIPYADSILEVAFDFIDHNMRLMTSRGDLKTLRLSPRSVADFYAELTTALASLGLEHVIDQVPEEIANPIPYPNDREHASYDSEAVGRWWQAIVQVSTIFQQHLATFAGRASPVQFFCGSFDLSYVRYSGRIEEGTGEAERIETGFWPGGGKVPDAAFYSYPLPPLAGIERAAVRPSSAHWNPDLGYFLLTYEDLRASAAPQLALREFLRSCYEAAADLGGWPRAQLERVPGQSSA